nr:MAG TPA: hypothetical protein [Bacteriophage sp.]
MVYEATIISVFMISPLFYIKDRGIISQKVRNINMFVNPFVLGILTTIFVEMAVLIIWSLLSGRK